MDLWVRDVQKWLNDTYSPVPDIPHIAEDGKTGWSTVNALTRALQYELGISPLSNVFGPGTLAALQAKGSINNSTTPTNIIRIAQAGLYCKGYNGGTLDGVWGSTAQASLQQLRTDMGLVPGSGSVDPKVFKALLNMDAFVLVAGGSPLIRQIQQNLNGRYLGRQNFFIVPTDGFFSRSVQNALMYALQYEIGMTDSVANGNFGPGTQQGIRDQAILQSGSVDSTKYFVHLFQAALAFNGYPVPFDGNFSSTTLAEVINFQNFTKLPATGKADFQTWASLLVSTGDPNRPGTGADCVTTLGVDRLNTLRNAGYSHFGRYLTNTPDGALDKCIKDGEVERVIAAGGRVFPIFQTGGGTPSHFTYQRGKEVAEEAANAAWAYRLPANTVIYFTVDWDAMDDQITSMIIPYFQGVNEAIGIAGRAYRVGVYGARNICSRVSAAGLATFSFVSDMSVAYSGNLGYRLPPNWAFDQIQTLTIGTGFAAIQIDKNIVSGRDSAVGALAAQIGVGNDPVIPADRVDAFEQEWYDWCQRYSENPAQAVVMTANRNIVKSRVQRHDAYITSLASQYSVYKALILTPLIWESMVINVGDDHRDMSVQNYYHAKSNGQDPEPHLVDDSSTGPCQIFARTAIAARNFASARGLLQERTYNPDRWEDVWEIWQRLNLDEQFNIQTALFVTMMEAQNKAAQLYTELRELNPSQVTRTFVGYNGGSVYGRTKAQLYYLIRRWHEDFR